VTAFDQRLEASKAVSDARRQELRNQVEKTVAALVYPAWKRGIDLLQRSSPKATDDAGLWRFKDGAEAYAFTLRRYTTTSPRPINSRDRVEAVASLEKDGRRPAEARAHAGTLKARWTR